MFEKNFRVSLKRSKFNFQKFSQYPMKKAINIIG